MKNSDNGVFNIQDYPFIVETCFLIYLSAWVHLIYYGALEVLSYFYNGSDELFNQSEKRHNMYGNQSKAVKQMSADLGKVPDDQPILLVPPSPPDPPNPQ